MTKTLEKQLPKLYTYETLENAKVVAHYFNPCGRGDWYVLEGERREDGDFLFLGYVKSPLSPDFDELGYFTLSQLESVKIKPFGLGIERDLYFDKDTYLKDVMS